MVKAKEPDKSEAGNMTTRSTTQSNDMEKQMQMMRKWNERLKYNNKDIFLLKNVEKMENTKYYKTFMEDYGVMPLTDREMAGKLHRELVEGYMKGEKKYEADDGALTLNNTKYKGYNMYLNHKISTNEAEAKHNQKVATTSIIGKELRTVRSSLDTLHIITAEVEKLTVLR